jgi:hypothetical protein
MKIFLSYPRENAEIAEHMVKQLQAAGFDVWTFLSLSEEQRQDRELRRKFRQEGLEKTDGVVVLVSPYFNRSVGVAQEIIYAQHRGKFVLPVVVQPTEIPFQFLGTELVDISDDVTGGIEKVVHQLHQIEHNQPSANPPDTLSAEQLNIIGERVFQNAPLDRVFIAYSRKQRALAKELCELLLKNGKAVFWDAKIIAGAMWRQTIQRALDDASHVVVVWTPDAAASDEVEREVSYALSEGKVIVPLLGKDIPKLPYHLHGLHYIILEDNLAEIEADLLKALAQYSQNGDIWQ